MSKVTTSTPTTTTTKTTAVPKTKTTKAAKAKATPVVTETPVVEAPTPVVEAPTPVVETPTPVVEESVPVDTMKMRFEALIKSKQDYMNDIKREIQELRKMQRDHEHAVKDA